LKSSGKSKAAGKKHAATPDNKNALSAETDEDDPIFTVPVHKKCAAPADNNVFGAETDEEAIILTGPVVGE
jgi:hypothetical protein